MQGNLYSNPDKSTAYPQLEQFVAYVVKKAKATFIIELLITRTAPNWAMIDLKSGPTLVEKQQSFIRFYMLPNTFWRILEDSYKIFHA